MGPSFGGEPVSSVPFLLQSPGAERALSERRGSGVPRLPWGSRLWMFSLTLVISGVFPSCSGGSSGLQALR